MKEMRKNWENEEEIITQFYSDKSKSAFKDNSYANYDLQQVYCLYVFNINNKDDSSG